MKNSNSDYLSYSRAYTFITDRWDFVRQYILKEPKYEKENKFKRMHKLLKIYFKETEKIVNQDKKMSKQRKEFYKNYSDKHLVTESENEFLKRFLDFINIDYNKDIKRCLEEGFYELEIEDSIYKIRGEIDCTDGHMIIDFKGEGIGSLKMKKLKYAMQQVVYEHLYKHKLKTPEVKFYFLSLPLTKPYSFNRFTFPSIWTDGVKQLFFDKIHKEYTEYVEDLKRVLGNDVFLKKFDNHSEVLNILNKNKLLSVDFEIVPSSYELKDLDLMMLGDKNKVELY